MHWPRTLASRLSLIFLIGLILAQALSFGAQYYERYESSKNTMLGNLETDVSTSIAILDRLPANERAAGCSNCNGPITVICSVTAKKARRWTWTCRGADGDGLDQGRHRPGLPDDLHRHSRAEKHFQVHLKLSDGSPLTIDVRPSMVPLSPWLPIVLLGQLALMLACTWLAVRIAIRP
jgi:hypothetical protein